MIRPLTETEYRILVALRLYRYLTATQTEPSDFSQMGGIAMPQCGTMPHW